MLGVLYRAEEALPKLLDTTQWNSLLIDYHPPFVERLWCDWAKYRLFLHRIHTCEAGQALFHPHPWPSAMRIVSGTYEMGVGYTSADSPPPIAARIILPAGSAYEMTAPHGWHYVRPLTEVTLSVMVTGKPWSRQAPKSNKQLNPLSPEVVVGLLHAFQRYYR